MNKKYLVQLKHRQFCTQNDHAAYTHHPHSLHSKIGSKCPTHGFLSIARANVLIINNIAPETPSIFAATLWYFHPPYLPVFSILQEKSWIPAISIPFFLIAKYTSKLIENTHPNSHPNSHPNIFLPLKQMPQSIKTGSKRLLPVQFS